MDAVTAPDGSGVAATPPHPARPVPPLLELLGHKRILVCVGSGGVGKTTTSASIAVRAASQGKKTLVLTIDLVQSGVA